MSHESEFLQVGDLVTDLVGDGILGIIVDVKKHSIMPKDCYEVLWNDGRKINEYLDFNLIKVS